MSESKILTGAREAVSAAKGEQPAAAIWHNGHRYVAADEVERLRFQLAGTVEVSDANGRRASAADAEIERLREALDAAGYLIVLYRLLHSGKAVRDLGEAEMAYTVAVAKADAARLALEPTP